MNSRRLMLISPDYEVIAPLESARRPASEWSTAVTPNFEGRNRERCVSYFTLRWDIIPHLRFVFRPRAFDLQTSASSLGEVPPGLPPRVYAEGWARLREEG